jgi:hypothetical protein
MILQPICLCSFPQIIRKPYSLYRCFIVHLSSFLPPRVSRKSRCHKPCDGLKGFRDTAFDIFLFKNSSVCFIFVYSLLRWFLFLSLSIFLEITNLMHLFMYLFISCLYMFRVSQCSSSGDRIVLIHHLVLLVYVSDCLVCRSGGKCSSLLTGIPSSHLHRLIIPDDVLIKFDLLMMSTVILETCWEWK